jgi:uncharacterized protein YybS (DUF2232 family)
MALARGMSMIDPAMLSRAKLRQTEGGEVTSARRMTPIEVAEGALLADLAVLCQLVWTYLPLPGLFFRFLIPTIFAVIVLRRRLAVGLLALAVAVFVAGVVTGPNLLDLIYMGLEGVGGLFLGLTMRRRWGHLPILAVGTIGLALSSAAVAILTIVIFLPISEVLKDYQRLYETAVGTIDTLTGALGIYASWRATVYPIVATVTALALQYWVLLIFLNSLAIAVPTTIVMYLLTNFLVRLLGHEVAPFPGGLIHRLVLRWTRRLVRFGLRHRLLRRKVPG